MIQKKYKLRRWVKITLVVLCTIALATSIFLLTKKTNISKPEPIATLCIDPGHGDYDTGTIGADGSYEKDINLAISLAIGEYIEENEPRIEVIYTHEDDTIPWEHEEGEDLKARVEFATDHDADYYLSIHMNSNYDPSAFGYESYVREDDTFSQETVDLIAENLDAAGWQYNRGTLFVEEYPLYVVSQQTIPALLFEAGFMSNYTECVDLQQKSNQQTIAKAIGDAYIQMILKDKEVDTEE